MSNPKLSVIIPIFNAEPYLSQCLESICGQTYTNLEIIALNDGSTDSSLETMQAFAAHDSRIRIIDKQNQGYGATCNRGLTEATGVWISIIEPDDWILPNMYADMIAFAQQFDEAGTPLDIVKTPYWRIVNPDTSEQQKINCSYKRRVKPSKQPFVLKDAPHLIYHHPSIWSAIYRKSFLNEKSIHFKEIPGAGWADNPFLIESLGQANAIGYFDTPYYCYREETSEHYKAFIRKTPTIPLERWHDMKDVTERLQINDEPTQRALTSRGFTYLLDIIEQGGYERDDVIALAARMFERMDPQIVFSDSEIPAQLKQMFAESRGIECPHINPLPHLGKLIAQGFYSMRNIGIANTIATTKSYFSKRAKR